ncbi:MAG: hypothetical protein Fur006_47350 [Coleofasciculaceae cyanobacterium]
MGIVSGCNRVPLLGRNQSANQAGDSPEVTQDRPDTQTRVQRANQPVRQAQSNTQGNPQSPDATLNPEAPNTAAGQSGGNQGVSALW